jgi:hypothetical protein
MEKSTTNKGDTMTILCIPHAQDLIRGGPGCTICALEKQLKEEQEFSRQQVRLVAAHASEIERLEEIIRMSDGYGMTLMNFPSMDPRIPNNDMVICPHCACQFVAIPVNIQERLKAAETALSITEGLLLDKIRCTCSESLFHKANCELVQEQNRVGKL